ncbi:MAG: hypothetical protein QOI24_3820 [Acidobacteriota bacterium]|nr:hypothetical protein [Acidobacteriota bacterium]
MRLSSVVVPFISVALVCSSMSAAQVAKTPGKYAVIIDSHLATQPLTGGFGRGTSKALYVLNESLRHNFESVTFVRKQPAKVKPYDAVIIITPQGESTITQDSNSTGHITLSYVIQKCNAPDQRGMLTYDLGLGTLGGLRELVKAAAATPVPSAASAGAR